MVLIAYVWFDWNDGEEEAKGKTKTKFQYLIKNTAMREIECHSNEKIFFSNKTIDKWPRSQTKVKKKMTDFW